MATRAKVLTSSSRSTALVAVTHRLAAGRLGFAGAVVSLAGLTVACGAADQEQVGEVSQASVRTPQLPLDGNTVPKFVDQLPTFNGRRQNASVTLNVSMQEFQQKVLPASVYAGRPAPFNNGTFLWGYNINGAGPSYPAARSRQPEATQRLRFTRTTWSTPGSKA